MNGIHRIGKQVMGFVRVLFILGVMAGIMGSPVYAENRPDSNPDAAGTSDPAKQEDLKFEIHEIRVEGNTLLKDEDIKKLAAPFCGPDKTARNVEEARMVLENTYREKGYPTVIVNIPEQKVTEGIVKLDVVEQKIGVVRINGNRYFTMEKIYRDLPMFAKGEILYMPEAQKQLNALNMNPDLKVRPMLKAGETPGTVDVDLNVTDKSPLHGSLEVNNRASLNTTALRMNGVLHYDNLWQKEHSLSLQFQTSPEKTSEVKALSVSYMLHAPWNPSNFLAAYGVFSDSNVAFGDEFKVNGKGTMAGLRYVAQLPGGEDFSQNATLGIDYKKFKDSLYFSTTNTPDVTPVTYIPLSFAWQRAMGGKTSTTSVNAGLNLLLRGLGMDVSEYENKRYKARGNYIVLKGGFDHVQALPGGFGLSVKGEGQLSDQPLIANEQYSAGGMESVRGYWESEVSGDNAVSFSVELSTPDLLRRYAKKGEDGKPVPKYTFTPYVFYDMAWLGVREPLPGETDPGMIQGTGIGFRGIATRYFSYGFDWGLALNRTANTAPRDSRAYFRCKWAF